MNINLELLKVIKITSLKIYISLVTEKLETSDLDSRLKIIERVPLRTPPHTVVMSQKNHMTNLFISSYRGAIVIKFGQ